MISRTVLLIFIFLVYGTLYSFDISWKKVGASEYIMGEEDYLINTDSYFQFEELTPEELNKRNEELESEQYEFWGHEVKVDEFEISEYEVTVNQFKEFIKETAYEIAFIKENGIDPWSYFESEDAGIILLSYIDILAYVGFISEKTGWNIRIPTEAEWELAAKGKTQNRFPWGKEFKYIVDKDTKNDMLHSRMYSSIYLFEEDISPYDVKGLYGAKTCTLDSFSWDFGRRSPYYNPVNLETKEYSVISRGGFKYLYGDHENGILPKKSTSIFGIGHSTIRLVKTNIDTIFNVNEENESIYFQNSAHTNNSTTKVFSKCTESSDEIDEIGIENVFIIFKTTFKNVFNSKNDYWYRVIYSRDYGLYSNNTVCQGWIHGSDLNLLNKLWYELPNFLSPIISYDIDNPPVDDFISF